MSYLYGTRYKADENDLILALREVSLFLHLAFESYSEYQKGIVSRELLQD